MYFGIVKCSVKWAKPPDTIKKTGTTKDARHIKALPITEFSAISG